MSKQEVSIEFEGKQYSLETGRFAKFASGSVMVRCADSMVLVTVVASDKASENIDYLPLQVEYREKASAAGKFPGGFLKREGRPSDKEILSARLIDRPIRPMIPKAWNYETQIIANVFSFDTECNPDTLAAVGASAALMLSDVPFHGPISEVRVAKIDGQLVVNPSYEQLENATIDITVAGTDSSIVMVEGESKQISEQEFLEALQFAHERVKILNNLQNQLLALAGMEKREINDKIIPEEITEVIKSTTKDELNSYVHTVSTKSERKESRKNLREMALEKVTELFSTKEEYLLSPFDKWVDVTLDKLEQVGMRNMILDERIRLDGRKLNEIRPITCEIGVLPRSHGSALFTRGETQSLTSITLGTKRDEQLIDGLLPQYTERFILHYNFPPFSTGEVKRIGLGRREIGHGNLAMRALTTLLPGDEEFPYSIRIVSDILESNGSSSMATVCAGSLAMFDGGVPMLKPVAGIAMGLIKEEEKVAILSDILGDEDHLGDMDFKVTGTVDGITACQMDIKIEGISIDIMAQALEQARLGRLHILGIMNEAIAQPREDISPFAPRYTNMKVPTESIGAIIGTGGETIRSICKDTGVEINIEDDGTVMIASISQEASDRAVAIINSILAKPEEGLTYTGGIKEVREGLGLIVEFMPKRTGLVHISQIAHERTETIGDKFKAGEKVEVKLIEISNDGKFRLSIKALIPRPDGMPPEPERRFDDRRSSDRRPSDRDRGGDRGGNRGGDRGGDRRR